MENFKEEWKSKLIREISLSEYDMDEDYLELVLQYGYATMFAAVFPEAPIFALLNNLFEASIDLSKLGIPYTIHVYPSI